MARIVVCDQCSTKEGVHAGAYDLCAKCAVGILERLTKSTAPGVREVVIAAIGQPNQAGPDDGEKPATPAAPLSDEAKAAQRQAALDLEHQQRVYRVQPLVPIKSLPQTIKYGPRGEEVPVMVLEAVPGLAGWYFAKMVAGA